MDEQHDNQTEERRESEPAGPCAGERLAEARLALQISVHEIAKELHLDDAKVLALERNEFDVLGAPVFAKGHLKKYAQLVNVNPDDVLTDYYRMNRSSGAPPVIALRERPRQELSPGPWIVVIVAIVIAVSAYWWITYTPAPPKAAATPVIEEQPAEQVVVSLPTGAGTPDDTSAEANPAASQVTESVTTDAAAAAAELEPAPAPQPRIAADRLHLLVTYTGDCWTDISDATGRRLFFGLGKDGRTVELSGEAPFNALFGMAANVTLQVNGENYPIPAAQVRGDTARLVIHGE